MDYQKFGSHNGAFYKAAVGKLKQVADCGFFLLRAVPSVPWFLAVVVSVIAAAWSARFSFPLNALLAILAGSVFGSIAGLCCLCHWKNYIRAGWQFFFK